MKKENMTLVDTYIKATNTHDFDQVAKLLKTDAVYQFTDKKCIGMEEIRAYFEHAWDNVKEEKYFATNITCIVYTKEVRVYVYEYHYEGYHNSIFTKGGGKATNIFQFINHEWKLVLEHLN